MKLSVIIPAYNEIETIRQVLDQVTSLELDLEIVVVDDGSTDGTRELLNELKGPGLKVVFHERNKGKGGAIRTALPYCKGEVVIIQDADLEYDPNDYYALLKLFENPDCHVVYGSRLLKKDYHRGSLRFYLGGRLITMTVNLLFGSRLTDEPTCYKLFRRKLISSLPLKGNGFELEPEITAKLLRRGYTIYEAPIAYDPRDVIHGKKIKARDGLIAIWTLLRYRFRGLSSGPISRWGRFDRPPAPPHESVRCTRRFRSWAPPAPGTDCRPV